MLPAGNRLRRRRDFAAAVRGRRAARPSIVVHLHVGDHLGDSDRATDRSPQQSRVGFVVARSVGGAVTRNAIRRRLRHLIRDRLDRLPPGGLVVVRATPVAASRTYAELAADIDSALDRVLDSRSRSR